MIEIRKTYNDLHNIKGRQHVQNLPAGILELRQTLMDELRLLHGRAHLLNTCPLLPSKRGSKSITQGLMIPQNLGSPVH